MAAPLRINTTTPRSLKVMSGTEPTYIYHQILTEFASSNTGVGTVVCNPASNTGLTLIGTFTDTYRNFTAGAHPIGTTITSVVYDFYQDLQTASETSMVRPVEYREGAPDDIIEQVNASLDSDINTPTIANLVSSGLGSYALQPTTPAGGTWVAEKTITNNLESAVSNVTYLWRKTATSAPTTVLPLKVNNTTPKSLKEMSDAEIRTLAARFRNRIVSSAIGTYKVQSASPSPGTWITAGAAFSDTTRTASDASYGGSFTGAAVYSGQYFGSYSRDYTATYAGSYSGAQFAGSYNVGNFAGPSYSGANYTGNFAGTYTRGGFVGGYAGAYSGIRQPASYTLNYGINTIGTYTATYSGTYFGPTYYGTYFGGDFAGSYIRGTYSPSYNAVYSRTYSGSYSPTYTGGYNRNFTRAFTGPYVGNYTGVAGYGSSFTGLTLNNDSSTVTTVSLWLRTA